MQAPDGGGPAGGEMQFDRADTKDGSAAVGCTYCKASISDAYYMINENISCTGCKDQSAAAMTGGSGLMRFVRALVAGVLAGAVGSLIYFGILKLTGYEFGLIAIVVGLMVGVAVQWGCGGRGGWFYQILAMLITYSAIVTTYIPYVLEEWDKTDPQAAAAGFLGRWIAAFIVAFILPFLSGIQNIIGILIIGFALYEAWKLNKRGAFQVTGPYQVAQGGAAAATPAPG